MAINIPSLKELVAIGAHFGHHRSKISPKARKFTFGVKDRIYVIDLEQTRARLAEVSEVATKLAAEGKTFLFVGTKDQAKEAVKEAGLATEMPYIDYRWLGGTLTNFETILKNIKKMAEYSVLVESEVFNEYKKKERGRIIKKLEKLNRVLGGLKNLKSLPDVLVIVDIAEEKVAAAEAKVTDVPIIGIVDTNVNPDLVTYPIPANDDSRKTIKAILGVLAEAINEGRAQKPMPKLEPEGPTETKTETKQKATPAKKTSTKKKIKEA